MPVTPANYFIRAHLSSIDKLPEHNKFKPRVTLVLLSYAARSQAGTPNEILRPRRTYKGALFWAKSISIPNDDETSLLWKELPKENDVLYSDNPSFTGSSAFWKMMGQDSCSAEIQEIGEFRAKLNHVKQTLLDGIGCGEGNCTHISILSKGPSALRQAPRFGVYTLHALHDGFPVYVRHASDQVFLYYKEEYDKWAYSHRIERWIVGPRIGDSEGGLMFLKRYPNPSFCCSVLNVTSNNRVLQYHPEKIGIYRKISRPDKLNFQLPVFKMDGKEFYLYSHHPLGRLWLIGSTYVSWSLRLNLIHNRHLDSYYCPEEPLLQDSHEDLKKQWLRAIPRKDFVPSKQSRVCCSHFHVSTFQLKKNHSKVCEKERKSVEPTLSACIDSDIIARFEEIQEKIDRSSLVHGIPENFIKDSATFFAISTKNELTLSTLNALDHYAEEKPENKDLKETADVLRTLKRFWICVNVCFTTFQISKKDSALKPITASEGDQVNFLNLIC
ncbi:unnamed protein product [Lepeophtheirus salmonis]|uniref:(salmon louse) hypothetical protein n=1 Tax=Lepeophtheirus salmonis TaxID=72036 RepID=A0A7R8CYD2_LEPSM|nr:unnamed protein product [Lepeophtheirus salmonis]CAF2967835.1 unnamed protein product [Lepeophtheirus salmonis]